MMLSAPQKKIVWSIPQRDSKGMGWHQLNDFTYKMGSVSWDNLKSEGQRAWYPRNWQTGEKLPLNVPWQSTNLRLRTSDMCNMRCLEIQSVLIPPGFIAFFLRCANSSWTSSILDRLQQSSYQIQYLVVWIRSMPNSFWGKPKTTKQQQRIIEKGHLRWAKIMQTRNVFLCWLHRVFIKRREGYWWKAEGGRKNGNFPEAMASRAIRRSVSNWESCSAALLCLPHVTPQHNNTQHTASLHQAGMMSLTPMLTQIEIEIQNQLDVDLENRCVVFRVQKETQINSKFSLWSKLKFICM